MKSLRSTLPTRAIGVAVGVAFGLAAVLSTSMLQAQTQTPYKVIGPDGKVTYTDRPAASDTRVAPVGSGSTSSTSAPAPLPLELRQTVARYPVTLYVAGDGCDPCNSGRQLLRQRGIPFVEKQVLNQEDSVALQRLSGGIEAPTLGIGAQILRGLSPEVWNSYLDAAGYPRDSRLPSNYQYPAATPLIARAAPPSVAAPAPQTDTTPTLPNLPNATGIRF